MCMCVDVCVCNDSTIKYTCSIVKEEISDDASTLPLVNGRVVAWVCLDTTNSY